MDEQVSSPVMVAMRKAALLRSRRTPFHRRSARHCPTSCIQTSVCIQHLEESGCMSSCWRPTKPKQQFAATSCNRKCANISRHNRSAESRAASTAHESTHFPLQIVSHLRICLHVHADRTPLSHPPQELKTNAVSAMCCSDRIHPFSAVLQTFALVVRVQCLVQSPVMLHAEAITVVAQAARHMASGAENALDCGFLAGVNPTGRRWAAALEPAAAAAKVPVRVIHKVVWHLICASPGELVKDIRL